MRPVNERHAIELPLPRAAGPAVEIIETLDRAGHSALLAGGCVRDLLLGAAPKDFDVATDATPERVGKLFRSTRHVGAQFGVVLVKCRDSWVEVATFRCDGRYVDGRRPTSVTFGDARGDALRRDFTINGLFYDPATKEVVDYVGGLEDLHHGVIRAIGDPSARFEEDYLRLLRAIRFSARLSFPLDDETRSAIQRSSMRLVAVASERVHDELAKMLSVPTRAAAWRLLIDTGLGEHLWPPPALSDAQCERAAHLIGALPATADFATAFAALVADHSSTEIERITRYLSFSNEQREAVLWIVANQDRLDDVDQLELATLKRMLVAPAFDQLRDFLSARLAGMPDGVSRRAAIDRRLASILPHTIAPAPFVTGEDLIARSLAPGPRFKAILDELYTRQLNEQLITRDDALAALQDLISERRQS